ncbi:MAG: hypothetical protein ACHRXM_05170 [Isosphaerales bacterium]
MAQFCRCEQVEIWANCLMPDHVHLIAVPQSADGLRRAIGEAHRRYRRRGNFREGWRGHRWQGHFASFALDKSYPPTALPSVVRLGLYGICVIHHPLRHAFPALNSAPKKFNSRTDRPQMACANPCLLGCSHLMGFEANDFFFQLIHEFFQRLSG